MGGNLWVQGHPGLKVSSKTPRATQRNPVLKNRNQPNKRRTDRLVRALGNGSFKHGYETLVPSLSCCSLTMLLSVWASSMLPASRPSSPQVQKQLGLLITAWTSDTLSQNKPSLSSSLLFVMVTESWLTQVVFLLNSGGTWPGREGDLGGSGCLSKGTEAKRYASCSGSTGSLLCTCMKTIEIRCREPRMSGWCVIVQYVCSRAFLTLKVEEFI